MRMRLKKRTGRVLREKDAVRAGERVKHMAAMEAYKNGTLQKDIKKSKRNGKS